MGHLGLKPDEFWALTPMELSLMLQPVAGAPAMSRGGLEQLMHSYPDREVGHDDG